MTIDNELTSADDVLDSGVLSDAELSEMIAGSDPARPTEEEVLLKRLMDEEAGNATPPEAQLPKQPRRARKERLCFFQHSPNNIPLAVADMAVRHYNTTDKPVSSIVRWINEKLVANSKPPIDVIDFYFLIVERLAQGRVKDRHAGSTGRGEVTIDEFNKFYLAWKSGLSSKDCARAIGRDSTTYTYHQLFAPLNKRDKKLKDTASSNPQMRQADSMLNSTALKSIFGHAERRVIGGRLAFVLFADKLGQEVQKTLYQAVPVLRIVMEHANTDGQIIDEAEAPHASPKDGSGKDEDMPEVSDVDARPAISNHENSTPSRVEKEGSTSGHFRVGDMAKRPTFGK